MGHTVEHKTRLLQRVRRLRGQVEAIERALQKDADCAKVMQLTVSARGAANSLMAELLEDHIRLHVSDPARDRDRARAPGSATSHRGGARLPEIGAQRGCQSPPRALTRSTVALVRRMLMSTAARWAASAAFSVDTTSR